MKRSRFGEAQFIGILKQHQARLTAAEICRTHPISDAIFRDWRSCIGGIEVSDAKLKTMLAEQMMDVATLNEMRGETTSEAVATGEPV